MIAVETASPGIHAEAGVNFGRFSSPRQHPIVITPSVNVERLSNAVVFFAQNIDGLTCTQLFHLLFQLDFEHFAQTGLSVTGLSYLARAVGPVPRLGANVQWATDDGIQALATRQFDDGDFSPRKMAIMHEVASRYRDADVGRDVNDPAIANGAWAKTWKLGRGDGHLIPYALGIADNDPRRQASLDTADEYSRFLI